MLRDIAHNTNLAYGEQPAVMRPLILGEADCDTVARESSSVHPLHLWSHIVHDEARSCPPRRDEPSQNIRAQCCATIATGRIAARLDVGGGAARPPRARAVPKILSDWAGHCSRANQPA